MKVNQSALEFFLSIPDDVLVDIATYDWESLEKLCWALTVDLQLVKEGNYEGISNWRELC